MALRDLKLTFRLDDKVSSKLTGLGRKLGGLNSPLAKVATGFRMLGRALTFVLGAAVAAGGALVAVLKRTIDRLDDVGDTAARLQVSTDALQEMAFAAQQADLSFEGLVAGLRTFSVRRGKLGLTGDLKSDLLTAAKAFEKLKTTGARADFANKVIGRGGTEMIPFLSLGVKELERLFEEAHRRDLVRSEEQLRAADAIDRHTKNIKSSFGAFTEGLSGRLLPTVESLTGRLDAWLSSKEGMETLDNLSTSIANAISSTANEIPKIVGALDQVVGIWERMQGAANGMANFFDAVLNPIDTIGGWGKRIDRQNFARVNPVVAKGVAPLSGDMTLNVRVVDPRGLLIGQGQGALRPGAGLTVGLDLGQCMATP